MTADAFGPGFTADSFHAMASYRSPATGMDAHTAACRVVQASVGVGLRIEFRGVDRDPIDDGRALVRHVTELVEAADTTSVDDELYRIGAVAELREVEAGMTGDGTDLYAAAVLFCVVPLQARAIADHGLTDLVAYVVE